VGSIPIGVNTGGAWDVFHSRLFQPPAKSYDDCERLLVDCVRSVSAINPNAVGADSMSVILGPYRDARVTFFPDPHHDTALLTAFSPWIVGPGIMHPPQEIRGSANITLHAGPHEVEFRRIPPTPPTNITEMRAQPRRRR
jgi:hypothetical protein